MQSIPIFGQVPAKADAFLKDGTPANITGNGQFAKALGAMKSLMTPSDSTEWPSETGAIRQNTQDFDGCCPKAEAPVDADAPVGKDQTKILLRQDGTSEVDEPAKGVLQSADTSETHVAVADKSKLVEFVDTPKQVRAINSETGEVSTNSARAIFDQANLIRSRIETSQSTVSVAPSESAIMQISIGPCLGPAHAVADASFAYSDAAKLNPPQVLPANPINDSNDMRRARATDVQIDSDVSTFVRNPDNEVLVPVRISSVPSNIDAAQTLEIATIAASDPQSSRNAETPTDHPTKPVIRNDASVEPRNVPAYGTEVPSIALTSNEGRSLGAVPVAQSNDLPSAKSLQVLSGSPEGDGDLAPIVAVNMGLPESANVQPNLQVNAQTQQESLTPKENPSAVHRVTVNDLPPTAADPVRNVGAKAEASLAPVFDSKSGRELQQSPNDRNVSNLMTSDRVQDHVTRETPNVRTEKAATQADLARPMQRADVQNPAQPVVEIRSAEPVSKNTSPHSENVTQPNRPIERSESVLPARQSVGGERAPENAQVTSDQPRPHPALAHEIVKFTATTSVGMTRNQISVEDPKLAVASHKTDATLTPDRVPVGLEKPGPLQASPVHQPFRFVSESNNLRGGVTSRDVSVGAEPARNQERIEIRALPTTDSSNKTNQTNATPVAQSATSAPTAAAAPPLMAPAQAFSYQLVESEHANSSRKEAEFAAISSGSTLSASPTHVEPAAPATNPRLAQQIAQQMLAQAQLKADGQIEISLRPEELGKVRMTLVVNEGAIVVGLAAERPETADLMRRHFDVLSEEFKQLGYRDITFEFSDNRQDRTDPKARDFSDDSDDVVDVAPTLAPAPLTIAGDSGIDIRL